MVAGRRIEYPRAMLYPAALRIVRTEHQPPDAEETRRLCAHRAGLQRDEQVAAGQPWIAQRHGGGTQGQQFGMGRGIVVRFHSVAGARQHGPVRPQHHRAHRHLAPFGGGARLLQGNLHRRCLGCGNHRFFLPGHGPGV